MRPRVQEALGGRFDRRVTALVAGAGFGKTSALVQTFEESRLRPLGRDHWLACEPEDADVTHAIGGLGTALGIDAPGDTETFIRQVLELLSAAAPSRQCIVLDDVHHIPEGSATAALLSELVLRLPANASLLLAGRVRPPVPLRRLELTGECVILDESDMALTADEVLELADRIGESTGPGRAITDLAGWPALVRLTLAHDEPAAFIWEEVLEMLEPQQVALLRMLVTVGECRDDVLAAATGVPTAEPLDRVPLVQRRGSHLGAHDLWATLLDDDGGEIDRRRRAMAALVEAGDAAAAVDLALARTPDPALDADLVDALRQALLLTATPEAPVLRRWARALPDRLDATGPARLLSGLVARMDNPGSEETHELLQRASQAFHEAGDTEATVAALGALAFAQHVRRDPRGLISTFEHLGALADAGEQTALPYQLLGKALVATAQALPAEVVRHTELLLDQALSTDIRAIALWLQANALSNLGHPATEPAAACYEIGLPLPGISFIHFGARWRAGMIADLRANPVQAMEGDRDTFLLATWNAIFHSALGEAEAARSWLADVESSSGDQSQWQTAGSVRIPQAAVALVEGDVDGAVEILDRMRQEHPLEGQAVGYYLASIPLYYPLFPDMRTWFDQQTDQGPLYQRDLVLNQAYVALVEKDDLDAVAAVPFPDDVGALITALGIRHAAELLAAAVAIGRPGADEVVADLIDLVGEPARTEFRNATGAAQPEIAAGARTVLESVPVRPALAASVAVLGETALSLGGEVIESADWRRERVRALLGFLILHRSTTREQAIAALWPDAEPSAGRRNLRSTLNVLNQVLEPDRIGGDAPFFVRSYGQRLQLVRDDHLSIDVERFEALADEAERLEAAGTPSLSIDPYLAAAAAYGGDLLPGTYDDWVVFERDRLKARFVRASVRAAELLVATGRAGEAIDIVAPALAAEPWAEAAHRALVAAYLELDDVPAARRAMATCHRVLEELGGPSDAATGELERRLDRLN